MKNTILSEKDSQLIETAILQHGRILNIHDLLGVFRRVYSKVSAHNRIHLLTRLGWFRHLKRGLYLIIDSLAARSQNDVSLLHIANVLDKNSYVSLAYALSDYQLFDQYSTTVMSVTTHSSKKYLFDGYIFRYSQVKPNLYFGFIEKTINGKKVRLAEPEKALIDYLYLDKSFSSASLVFEKLRDYHQELDLHKLQEYALRCGITIIRKIGFLLDQLHLHSELLHRVVKNNRGMSRFTVDSTSFNAKWRLYYDHRIVG